MRSRKKFKYPLTREEVELRRAKLLYLLLVLLWAVLIIAVLLGLEPVASCTEPEPPAEATMIIDAPPTPAEQEIMVVQEIQPPITVTEEVKVAEEPSPIRDDIPLDTETQMLLYQVCDETGVPFELALAVIWQETRFQNISGDSGNSAGYMQVQERFHWDRMERLGVTDLTDPYGNFLVGCDYLAEMIAKDRGIEWALMSYNGGMSYANKMAKAGKVSKYAESVLNYMNNLGGI